MKVIETTKEANKKRSRANKGTVTAVPDRDDRIWERNRRIRAHSSAANSPTSFGTSSNYFGALGGEKAEAQEPRGGTAKGRGRREGTRRRDKEREQGHRGKGSCYW